MTGALYTNIVSPHTMPLAKILSQSMDDFAYICQKRMTKNYLNGEIIENGKNGINQFLCESDSAEQSYNALEKTEVLITDRRNLEVFKSRNANGLLSFYDSERWLKPIQIFSPRKSETASGVLSVWLPGICKLAHPLFLSTARRFVSCLRYSKTLYYLPDGIHAARDMARLCGLFSGDFRCLFRAPELEFEKRPGGRIWLKGESCKSKASRKYCLDKMRIWGYYIEPSRKDAFQVQEAAKTKPPKEVKVLWVGRLLNLKRVDTIVRAVGEHANLKRVDTSLPKITLDIYGTGPEEKRLMKMAEKHGEVIRFYPPIAYSKVREEMRNHDVYVLSSNAFEGWGAVVSEALEEGMKVIGTYEAGASATILPSSNLFHSGDWRSLLKLLQGNIVNCGIGAWTVRNAASALLQLVEEIKDAW